MKLSIIIPAYNEEASIEDIINRCLAARDEIIRKTYIDEAEIIVVSDGSTDNTADIAKRFVPGIKLISYPDNRGYGIAIKTGFENSEGEIVSFLDADGTCDPYYFAEMLIRLEEELADICIGSRMGPDSQMPKIRRIGNILFRNIINMIAKSSVEDAASGMRIIRRDKLKILYPLPDGLSFTPGMTCRAVLDSGLKIVEINMSYKERQGKSKLNVIIDGFNFLKVIISIALTYKPLRILGPLGFVVIIMSFILGVRPVVLFMKTGNISDDQIWLLISVMLLGISGMILLGLASVSDKAVRMLNRTEQERTMLGNIIRWFFSWSKLWLIAPMLVLTGLLINLNTIKDWIETGILSQNWPYILTGGSFIMLGIVGFAFGVTDYLFVLIEQKKKFEDEHKD